MEWESGVKPKALQRLPPILMSKLDAVGSKTEPHSLVELPAAPQTTPRHQELRLTTTQISLDTPVSPPANRIFRRLYLSTPPARRARREPERLFRARV